MNKSSSFASTVDIVEGFIDIAVQRGDGQDLHALRRRARGILEPPKPPKTALEAEQSSINLEYEIWVEVIPEVLHPAQCDLLFAALRIEYEEDDPWAQLDPRVRQARERRREGETLLAEHAAIAACQRYQHTRHTSHLRDAVVELDSAMRVE